MLAALKYHLRHLADFSGRDARQTFWYWFLALFILNIAAGLAMSLPATAGAMSAAMTAVNTGSDPAAAQAAAMATMAGSMHTMLLLGIALGVANIVLIAAALVRRAHDSGKSGWWAVVTGAIYLFTLWQSWGSADEVAAMMRDMAGEPADAAAMQARMARQSLLGYLPIVLVIAIGLFKSTPGPNRYGDAPVSF